MGFSAVLKQIDELQQQIDSHQQLGTELLKKIQYRFRLDWNYHSNALEGNSLTRQETRSVMINNITVEGKPLKDVLEIRGHDNVITEVLRIGKGEKPLSEKRMKEIHKAILHEEDPEKMQLAGQWKTGHNHVINYRGEKFDFASPAEVAEAIHKLVDNTNAALENKSRHVVLVAFEFHLKFLTIHPFYDGNGRTARIFMNLLLIAAGYPPLIIKVEEKEQYNRYLADIQCYGGEPDLLYEFLGKILLRSQQIVLDAIAGKDISEPDDFEKELALIEQKYEIDYKNKKVVRKNAHQILFFLDNTLVDFEIKLTHKLERFTRLFSEANLKYVAFIDSSASENLISFLGVKDEFYVEGLSEIKNSIRTKEQHLQKLNLKLQWNGSGTTGPAVFGMNYLISFWFYDFNYEIRYPDQSGDHRINKKLYKDKFAEEELEDILQFILNTLLSIYKKKHKEITGKDLL